MIVVRSPLRISFVGGGSDIPPFCTKGEFGACVSSTIDSSVYVSVNHRPIEKTIRVSYSCTEIVDEVDEIQHELVRETLKMFLDADPGWDSRGLEIVSSADLPSETGLGSSGAFTVGLIQALNCLLKRYDSPFDLSRAASFIEMTRCRAPIGYQDQTASAYGGLRLYEFDDEGLVRSELLSGVDLRALQRRLLLVDLGTRQPSNEALSKLDPSDSRDRSTVRSLANLAKAFRDALLKGELDECGEIIEASWALKSQLEGVSTPEIDQFYEFTKENGAIGGKLCGAGGRGMFLLFTRSNSLVRSQLSMSIKSKFNYRSIPVQLYPDGSKPVYSS